MTAEVLDLVKQSILQPASLSETDIDRVMGTLLGASVEAADIYFQSRRYESWVLEDGIIKEGSHNIEQGAGVRAISGEKTGFAYSDKLELPVLLEAAKNVRAIARQGQTASVKVGAIAAYPQLYAAINPLQSMTDQDKIALLHTVDQETRKLDTRIEQVIVSLIGVHDSVLIASQDGSLAGDVRPLIRMNVTVIIEQDGRREQGSMGGGARSDYGTFFDQDKVLGYGREALRQAVVNFQAGPAPAGNMTVVLGPGWPGILLHEAIGHGLEGDFNRKGTSAFSGRVGERVDSELGTVVDDGTLPGRRG
jgi:TldD protein